MNLQVKRFALLIGLLAALSPVTAQAAVPKGTWATVNACDQAANTMGVRARIAGRKGERFYMHFEAQYFSLEKNRFVPTGASSPWRRVGSGPIPRAGRLDVLVRRATRRHRVRVPRGRALPVEGAEGRARWRVVRSASKFTTAGHASVQAAQPAGFSETFCVLKPPAP